MTVLKRALVVSLFSSNSSTLLYFIGSLLIARLLTPEEIGVYAVCIVILGVAQILREFGIGSYIVRERNLTRERLRAADGVLTVVSWPIAAGVFLASPLLGTIYGEPGIERVAKVLSLNFLLVPFGAITLALLKRHLRFGARAVIEVTSTAVYVCTAALLALNGGGYLSLAWASVAGMATSVVVTQFYRPAWLPWLPSLRHAGHLISFGVVVSAAQFGTALNQSTPELILGRMQGMQAAGYFTRAGGLVRVFSSVILQAFVHVALAHFSNRQGDKKGLTDSYLRFVEAITGAAWPFLVTLSIVAGPATILLFGSQWTASIPLVPVLCLASALTLPFSLTGAAVTAHGSPKIALKLEWLSLGLRVLALVLLAPVGIEACAWGQVMVGAAMAAVNVAILVRHVGVRVSGLIKSMTKSLGLTTACAALGGVMCAWAEAQDAGLAGQLAATLLGAATAYVAAALVLGHLVGQELKRWFSRG
jgi:O-antigen/teichoic acid export membrane protein